MSKKDKQAALYGIPLYKKDCEEHNRPMKYPATYLNGRTWEDEYSSNQEKVEEELPAGLTEEKWRTYVAWFKSKYPRICSKIQPLGFLKMMSYVHRKSQVLVKILNEIEKSDFDGDIVSEVYRISGEEPDKSEIM